MSYFLGEAQVACPEGSEHIYEDDWGALRRVLIYCGLHQRAIVGCAKGLLWAAPKGYCGLRQRAIVGLRQMAIVGCTKGLSLMAQSPIALWQTRRYAHGCPS